MKSLKINVASAQERNCRPSLNLPGCEYDIHNTFVLSQFHSGNESLITLTRHGLT